MEEEKRRFSRVGFNVRAKLAVEGREHVVERIANLSVGGCLLELDESLPPGAAALFTIFLPRIGPGVEVQGEVVRCGEGMVSLRFTRIDPENLYHLQNIIRYNAPDPDQIEQEIKSHPGLL